MSTALTTHPPGGRGCGNRKEGGTYACMSVGEEGTPMKYFMVDPPVPYLDGTPFQGVHEAPEYISASWDTQRDLVLTDWVGESGYACVPDFIEEARRYGMSRRLPSTFPFETIKGRNVWLALIHAKAAPVLHSKLDMVLNYAWDYDWCLMRGEAAHFPECLYHTWLTAFTIHGVDPNEKAIEMPWGPYYPLDMVYQPHALKDVFLPDLPGLLPADPEHPHPAFFAVFPITHLEAVQYVEEDVADRLDNSGLDLYVVEE